ncbi:MAG: glycosyltransferase family 39 protein, partial [Candidatus Omnitrophica bacterium]|nr:glycosyltransferase family 39 protein [Candidatus Omnitrophota bacterium]
MKNKKACLVIGLILIFYFLNNLIWLRQNNFPAGPDEFTHLTISLRFFRAISSSPLNILSCLSAQYTIWPPLFHVSSALLDFLIGTSYVASVMINMFYLIILLFSVYFIGRKLFDQNTGILAAVFISLYPMVFRYSRFFGTDFALAAMVSMSMCFLVYSDNFNNKRNSLLFGLSLGLGMLTKWSFIFFIVGPLALILCRTFSSRRNSSASLKQKLSIFGLSLTIGILISLIWYWPAFALVVKRVKMFAWSTSTHGFEANHQGPTFSHLNNFISYFYFLINEQLAFLFFMIFLIALSFYLRKGRNKLFLILWYVVPYFVLSLSTLVEGRYMLPALAAVALISAAGLQSIAAKRIRYLLYCSVILLGLAQFFDISYNPYRTGKTCFLFGSTRPVYLLYTPITGHYNRFSGAPFRKNLNIDRIPAAITGDNACDYLVGMIGEDRHTRDMFPNNSLDYYFLRQNITAGSTLESLNLFTEHEALFFLSELDRMDFIIFVSRSKPWPQFSDLKKPLNEVLEFIRFKQEFMRKDIFFKEVTFTVDDSFIEKAKKKIKDFLSEKDRRFVLDKEVKLSEGYSAYLYANKAANHAIRKDSLSLSFSNGRIRILYQNRLLSQGRGLSTSFTYQNKLYDSAQASWEVQRSPGQITATAS